MKRVSFGIILFFVALICVVPVSAVYVACTNGTAATIAVNWTFTGNPSTLALVNNVGTSQNALLDFTIPQGQAGGVGGDTSQYLFINGTRTMTGNLNINGQQITGVVSGSTGSSVVNKTYVDSLPGGSPPDLTPFIFINGTRAYTGSQSMGGFQITNLVTGVLGTNAANKTYVDTAIAGVQGGDTSQFLFINGTRGMVGNLNMSSSQILKLVTGATGDSAVNRTYVDSGLPYVLTTNATLVLTGNNSYVLTGGQRAFTADQSMGGFSLTNVNTGLNAGNAVNKSYVDSGLPYVLNTNSSLLLTTNASIATTTYVSSVNTSMKNYVDGKSSPDLSPFVFINGTRAFTGDISHGGFKITSLVTGLTGDSAVNKSYVDSGLPYVLATNSSLILSGNTSFVAATNTSLLLTSNTSVATTTLVSSTNTSMKNYVDNAVSGVGSPDLTPFLFINGTRAMTGNLSMGSKYINGVISGALGTDAVNKSYVDIHGSNYNASYYTSIGINNTVTLAAGQSATVTNVGSGQVASLNFGIPQGTQGNQGNQGNPGTPGAAATVGVNSTITGAAGSNAIVTNVGSSAAASFDFTIPRGDTGTVPDVSQFLFINGTRAMSGNLQMGNQQITGLVTGAAGTTAVNRSYVDSGLPYVTSSNSSIIIAGNTSFVAATNSSLMLTSNTSMLVNPVYGYMTMMAGSAMLPTTNPSNMDQAETATNKNNYIYTEFTDGGSENTQWIVDMPGDWNQADANKGKLTFNFLWTTVGGGAGQTVKFDIAGKVFPDDVAIDTALASVGTATDTWSAANQYMISPDTTGAVVTSAGTGGRTILFKVTRDSATDTLGATARLMGVRIKYIRTLA